MADEAEPAPWKSSDGFTQAIADKICLALIEGRSLRSICEQPDMPVKSTVMLWLNKEEAFRAQYTTAREMQADAVFDEVLDIADDGSNDWMSRRREDGSIDDVVNHEHVTRSRLRVDARKWVLARMSPKKYGDKLDLNHGGQGDNPLIHRVELTAVEPDHGDGEA